MKISNVIKGVTNILAIGGAAVLVFFFFGVSNDVGEAFDKRNAVTEELEAKGIETGFIRKVLDSDVLLLSEKTDLINADIQYQNSIEGSEAWKFQQEKKTNRLAKEAHRQQQLQIELNELLEEQRIAEGR